MPLHHTGHQFEYFFSGGEVEGDGHAEPGEAGPDGFVGKEDNCALVFFGDAHHLAEVSGGGGVGVEVVDFGEDEVHVPPGFEHGFCLVEGRGEGLVFEDELVGGEFPEAVGGGVVEEGEGGNIGADGAEDTEDPDWLGGFHDDEGDAGFEVAGDDFGGFEIVGHDYDCSSAWVRRVAVP